MSDGIVQGDADKPGIRVRLGGQEAFTKALRRCRWLACRTPGAWLTTVVGHRDRPVCGAVRGEM
jgi:hypothetical protein